MNIEWVLLANSDRVDTKELYLENILKINPSDLVYFDAFGTTETLPAKGDLPSLFIED